MAGLVRSSPAAVVVVLALVAFVNIGTAAALSLGRLGGAETALAHVGLFLKGRQGADSWKPIELARNYVDVNRTGVYDELFFREGVKFQYPPTALVLVGR